MNGKWSLSKTETQIRPLRISCIDLEFMDKTHKTMIVLLHSKCISDMMAVLYPQEKSQNAIWQNNAQDTSITCTS